MHTQSRLITVATKLALRTPEHELTRYRQVLHSLFPVMLTTQETPLRGGKTVVAVLAWQENCLAVTLCLVGTSQNTENSAPQPGRKVTGCIMERTSNQP